MKCNSLAEAPFLRSELSRKLLSDNGDAAFTEKLVTAIVPNELEQLVSSISRSVQNKQSDAVLVCGLPGCGKSALVDAALRRVTEGIIGNSSNNNSQKSKSPEKQLIIIRLTSVHSTDESAIEDIAMQVEEQTGCTLKTLAEESEDVLLGDRFGRVMSLLTTQSRPFAIVFILDPLEIFAARRSQGLLYTLVDSVHNADKLPICVLALSNRFGVLELLEKRVRSRFSGEQLLIPPCFNKDTAVNLMKLFLLGTPTKSQSAAQRDTIQRWNLTVTNFLQSKDTTSAVSYWLEKNPSIRDLKTILSRLIFQSGSGTFEDCLNSSRLLNTIDSFYNPPGHVALMALAPLELALLVSFHVAVTSNHHVVLLDAAYAVYEQFVRRHHEARFFCSKATALRAFERLVDAGLIQRNNAESAGSGWTGRLASATGQKTAALYTCSLQHFDLVEYLSASNTPPELQNFARVNLLPAANKKLLK